MGLLGLLLLYLLLSTVVFSEILLVLVREGVLFMLILDLFNPILGTILQLETTAVCKLVKITVIAFEVIV